MILARFTYDGGHFSAVETRTHFAAWVIVSSPLTLSHDVNNGTVMDAVWPIISNPEVIAVSQTYAGHSGSPFKNSSARVVLDSLNYAAMHKELDPLGEEAASLGPTNAPATQYFYKPLGGADIAVLLMNNGDAATDLELDFADVPGLKGTACTVRDLWSRSDLGQFDKTYTAKAVASHDAPFLKLTCPPAPPATANL